MKIEFKVREQGRCGKSTWFFITAAACFLFGAISPSFAVEIAETSTPEIQELARGLGNDPVKIYNYVHNEIRHVFYFGSKKGAHLTLLEKSGNDFDQCALLVALLRASGYSPTYEFGLMKIPYDEPSDPESKDLRHWIGYSLTNTNWSTTQGFIGAFDRSRGYPTEIFYGTNTVSLHRLWVKLPISGTNYYLDPAFKVSDSVPGVSLLQAMGVTVSGLTNDLNTAAGGTVTTNSIQSVNETALRSKLSDYTTAFLSTISTSYPNASVLDITGGQTIRSVDATSLSTTRSFDLDTSLSVLTWTDIPTNYMSSLTITFNNTTNSWYMPQLKGQRLALTFSATGVAELWLEDTRIVQTNTSSGVTIDVSMSVNHPFGTWDSSNNALVDGSNFDISDKVAPYQRTSASYAILYSFDPSPTLLRGREAKLDQYRAQGLSDTSREVTTETLNVLGLNWMLQRYLTRNLLAQQGNVSFASHHDMGRMALESGKGYYIDMYMPQFISAPLGGFANSELYRTATTAEADNFFSSALEHGIIEQLQSSSLVAASTVKVLQAASTTNANKVFIATSTNWSTVHPLLSNYTASDTNSFSSLISAGFHLLLPQNGLQSIGGGATWKGFGAYERYLVIGSGSLSLSGSLVISGGYNGGYAGTPTATPDPSFVAQTSAVQPAKYTQADPVLSHDPVNMFNGFFELDSTDLSFGQREPRGITFGHVYSNARINSNPTTMANGWTHNYLFKAVENSAAEAGLGQTTVAQMAPMLVATCAAYNYHDTDPDPKNWIVTALIAKWGVDQLNKNAVSITMGKDTVQFIKQPNGTYTPPANSTMILTLTNSAYQLHERNANTFKFDSSGKLTNIVDQYGKALALTYYTDGRVDKVTDPFGRNLTFNYTGTPLRLTSVAESDGVTANLRTVTFAYATTYNAGGDLVTITDPEGKDFHIEYDSAHRITKTKDAYNRVIVQNIYDSLGRVSTQYNQGDVTRAWKLFFNGVANVEEDPLGGTKTYFYDSKARLTGLMDALGNRSRSVYDGQDHAVAQITPKGETNTFEFNADQNLVKATDPTGAYITNTFDSNKRLSTTTDKRGKTTTYLYNMQHQVTKIVGPPVNNVLSNVVEMSYFTADAAGQVKGALDWRTDQDGYTNWFRYDAFGNLNKHILHNGDYETSIANYRGDVITNIDFRSKTYLFAYNLRRQVTNSTAPGSIVSKVLIDDTGHALKTIDPLLNETAFTNSATGKLLKTTLPTVAGQTPMFENHYDVRDWMDWSERQPGERITNSFDVAGRLQAVSDPLLRTNIFTYDANGSKLTATTALDVTPPQTTLLSYTARGQLNSSTNALTNVVSYLYDAAGNLTNLVNRRGNVFQTSYYDDGATATTATPLGNTTTISYNKRGLLSSLVLPSGNTSTLSYDFRGLLTNRTDSLGTISYTYDANGNLLTTTEGTKSITRMYDELNHMTNYAYVDTSDTACNYTLGFGFDNNSNLKSLVYPDGKVVRYTYDAQNRLSQVIDWANRTTSYEYDPAKPGRIKYVWNANGTHREFVYDDAGEVREIKEHRVGSAGSIQTLINYFSMVYDGAGRVTNEFTAPIPSSYVEATLSMTYDADNRLATFNGSGVVHDNDGNMTLGPLAAVNFTSYTYDARNRLVGLSSPATIQNAAYADNANNIGWAGSSSNCYGPVNLKVNGNPLVTGTTLLGPPRTNYTGWVGMLLRTGPTPLRVTHLGRWVVSGNTGTHAVKLVDGWNMDVANGSCTVATSGQPTNQFAYGALTTPVTLAANSYYYVFTQETYGGDTWYDYGNVLSIPGTSTTYAYDPSGNRVKVTQDSQTTRFAIDPSAALSQVLVRAAPSGAKTFYVYGAGLLYEVDEAGGTLTHHYDPRGSTVALTDRTGAVRTRYEYSPYGQITKSAFDYFNADTIFRYNGAYGVQSDSTGLMYMRARYYNPYIRRFINADPSGMAGGMNWYAYADGNPVSNLDPFGLSASDRITGTSWLNQAYNARTCMDCHGNLDILMNGVLPQDTPWFNAQGTETAYKTMLGSTAAIAGAAAVPSAYSWALANPYSATVLGLGATETAVGVATGYNGPSLVPAANIGGISAVEAENLNSALQAVPGVKGAAAFGSRTTGAYFKGSDLDIALFGNVKLTDSVVQRALRSAQSTVGPKLDVHVFQNEDDMFMQFLQLEQRDPIGKPLPNPVPLR